MILTHGANSIGGEKIPEILFASDDFVNIHAGTVLSTNVTQADTAAFSSKTWDYKGVLQDTYTRWNTSKRVIDFADRTITIGMPFSKMTEFSQQFYMACDNDTGGLYFSGSNVFLFSVYNDNWYVTLANYLSNKTAYNGGSIGTGPWDTDRITSVTYCNLGHGKWTFISIVGKKISGNLWEVYFYANGILYFSYRQSFTSDELTIWETKHSSTSDRHCYLSEMMLFSYSRASQDMQTYDTNGYAPLY